MGNVLETYYDPEIEFMKALVEHLLYELPVIIGSGMPENDLRAYIRASQEQIIKLHQEHDDGRSYFSELWNTVIAPQEDIFMDLGDSHTPAEIHQIACEIFGELSVDEEDLEIQQELDKIDEECTEEQS